MAAPDDDAVPESQAAPGARAAAPGPAPESPAPESPAPGRVPLWQRAGTLGDIRRWLVRSLLVALAYAAIGVLGLALPGVPPYVSAFWPPAGLALAVQVRWGPAYLPALVLAAWWVELQAELPPALGLALALGSAFGPALAAWWLRRMGVRPRLDNWRDLALTIGIGALGGTLLSAANGSAWLALSQRVSVLELPQTALLWWLGDAVGVLIAGVPLLALRRGDLLRALAGDARRRVRAALLAMAAALTAVTLASPVTALAPLALALAALATPPLVLGWLVLRDGIGTASALVLLMAVALMGLTGSGIGLFAAVGGTLGLCLMWAYVALLAALVLAIGVEVSALARREARAQFALLGSDIGIADWSLDGSSSFCSPRWRALMADASGELSSSFERWLSLVHVQDQPPLRAISAQPVPAAHEPDAGIAREARVRVADRWRWYEVQLAVAERDDAGRPSRIVATATDVASRRSAEEHQRVSRDVYRHLTDGLAIADAQMRIVEANPTYCRLAETPREALLGTVPELLQPSAADPLAQQQVADLWHALRVHGQWSGELVLRRRNGEPYALEVTVSAVAASDSAARYHVVVVNDVTEQRLQREQLARQAHFDELTRLPNRTRLAELMAEAIAAADRDGSLLVVCYLDIDHFKAVNDRLGHDQGDLLLAELAERMRAVLRMRGRGWSDTAARLGGDEFVLLLRARTVDEARAAVQRVLRLMSQPIVLQPGTAREVVTASVGATLYPLDRSDADTLLRHADHAMYSAKQCGRNGFLFFDAEYSRRTEERMVAIDRLQAALDQGELVLYYQPKVDLKRGQVLGVEALIRWNHPQDGMVSPAQFLPLIEDTALSARFGDHVLSQALEQLARWHADGLALSVSVNISARHLQEPGFVPRLAELLARHPPALGGRLELEVLETAALADIAFTAELMTRCAALGVRWAVDDFGTGYSTLTYLKRLPLQVLKIDRSFVSHMLDDAQDRAIVKGVISLAKTFGCSVVAEGVESAAQVRTLLEMGCDIGQGVGIAPAMPAADIAGWVRDWRGLFVLSAAPAPTAPTAPVVAGDAPGQPRTPPDAGSAAD